MLAAYALGEKMPEVKHATKSSMGFLVNSPLSLSLLSRPKSTNTVHWLSVGAIKSYTLDTVQNRTCGGVSSLWHY